MRTFHVLKAFLGDKKVATPFPSSRFTVNKLLGCIDTTKLKTVVEYGPGDGVVTKQILKSLPKDAVFLAIEQNPNFVKMLQEIKDPRLHVIQGDACSVKQYLAQLKLKEADLVLASIPFVQIPEGPRKTILEDTHAILSASGMFLVYQHIPLIYTSLKKLFPVTKVKFSTLNFPPYFIFQAMK